MFTEPKKIFVSPIFIMSTFITAKTLDLATTYAGITSGMAYEANPFSAILLLKGGWFLLCFVGIFMATVSGIFFVVWQYYLCTRPSADNLLLICRGGILLWLAVSVVPVVNNLFCILPGFYY